MNNKLNSAFNDKTDFKSAFKRIKVPLFQILCADFYAEKYGNNSFELKLFILLILLNSSKGNFSLPLTALNAELIFSHLLTYYEMTQDERIGLLSHISNIISDLKNIISSNMLLFGDAVSNKPFIIHGNQIFINKYFKLEQRLIKCMHERITASALSFDETELTNSLNESVNHLYETCGIKPNLLQMEAIKLSLKNNFVFISGGPGTGKTLTALSILRAYLYLQTLKNPDIKPDLILTAPTGRASAKLSESIISFSQSSNVSNEIRRKIDLMLPLKGITLHRLLASFIDKDPIFSPTKKISCDVIIIDESSMVNFELFTLLLESLPLTAKIIFIGDKNQLPSIDGPDVFKELLPSKNNEFHKLSNNTIELKDSLRLSKKIREFSDIVCNEEFHKLDACLNSDNSDNFLASDSISFYETDNTSREFILNIVRKYFTQDILDELDSLKNLNSNDSKFLFHISRLFNYMNNFKILCSVNEGILGVDDINKIFNDFFNHSASGYFHGQIILITKNDYKNALFNGDIGIILNLKNEGLICVFPGEKAFKTFPLFNIKHFTTGFAMTIHKSQGGEYDNVLISIPPKQHHMLSKELLYTAITRARKSLLILSGKNYIKEIISVQDETAQSNLKDFLYSDKSS